MKKCHSVGGSKVGGLGAGRGGGGGGSTHPSILSGEKMGLGPSELAMGVVGVSALR